MRIKQQVPYVRRVNNLKRQKGKCTVALTRDLNLEVKSTDKSSVKKMDVKKTKTEDTNDCMVGGCRESATTPEWLSSDCYELHENTPHLEELCEGKENGLRYELENYRTTTLPERIQGEETEEVVVTEQSIFLDDDSNHVLPVEKFFGNMEVVQDCLQRTTTTSICSRREHRRRQYYAKEDSDDEIYTDLKQNDIGGIKSCQWDG
ncbi:hypothetical protein DPEC_G00009680 [Dallia pectoralis]|uniref:Uncharacterized protein n=1 Tax=Dallia pectoralis TaxID=75939 RepID=A0ACC2HLH8_DALPE|nr:hypothetical protein DPEC_G00009680 [Dallia pectoralis]